MLPGFIALAALILEDITNGDSTMKTERQVRESVRENQQVAKLAHELRSPLAALHNAAELLARAAADDPAIKRIGDIVMRQTTTMRALVEELLDVSRLDAGRLQIALRRLDLRAVAAAVIEDHRSDIERAGLRYSVDLDAEPVWVMGDGVKLRQVLANLVSNAIKFTPAPGSIEVAVRATEQYATLGVRDSGVGIPPELIGSVFEHYRQADPGGHGGLGLGLPIAKGIVEQHDGEITASSEGPGLGCLIEVRLPVHGGDLASRAVAPS
jgi:signal transduction histidine kinase